ncbi:hypothetical protein Taro_012022 [Colocasia esculenta]|uniref:Uncharacterized protein n=1 Tax=Colocasia esculenta TaxID=4460 RepID=A0A843UCC7_COLES|nr:hypothetical protein [Colocasia esculenta]
MSPSVDLSTKPDRLLLGHQHRPNWKQRALPSFQDNAIALNPAEVCEQEQIDFQQKKNALKTFGAETLFDLTSMNSKWSKNGPNMMPFHNVWVLSFDSPNKLGLRRIVESYNDSRISFISSSYDFKYYGRFQIPLQYEAEFINILDDDMIPSKKILEILSHVGGTDNHKKFRSKEAGLYLPDPAYDMTVDKIERQLLRAAGGPERQGDMGDYSEHRVASVFETTVIFKDILQVQDDQW